MFQSVVIVALCLSPAQVPAKPKSEDQFPRMAKAMKERVSLRDSMKGQNYCVIVGLVEKQHGLKMIVRMDLFREQERTEKDHEFEERSMRIDENLSGLEVRHFLRLCLADLGATYVIKSNHVEVIPWFAAADYHDEADVQMTAKQLRPTKYMLKNPLVCASADDEPLEAILNDLAAGYDQTVVLSEKAKGKFLDNHTLRIRNVPFPTALEMVAAQANLVVLKKDDGYFVTTPDHAAEVRKNNFTWKPLK